METCSQRWLGPCCSCCSAAAWSPTCCSRARKGITPAGSCITVGWGVAVAVAIYAVGRISGAHLNPAVTIGLASIGSFAWTDVPGYIAAQVLGAFLGAALVWLAYLPHWAITTDPGAKLGVFCNRPAVRHPVANVITEIIGTAVLVFGVLAIGANAQSLTRPNEIESLGGLQRRSAVRCSSASWCSALASRSEGRLATPSTRRATSGRASHMLFSRFRGRAILTGVTRGFRSSGQSSAASWGRCSSRSWVSSEA